MATNGTITATEILEELIEPIDSSLAPEFARMLLQLRLSDKSQERIRELVGRNNSGALNPDEKAALENYLLVGQFVDLLHAKARARLQGRASAP